MNCDPFDQAFAGPGIDACPGLTKREYFAAQAFAGIAASTDEYLPPGEVARVAVVWADALIAELNK